MSESTKKEAGLQNHYHITSTVEKHKIPESLVSKQDQNMFKLDILTWQRKVQRKLASQELLINK